MEQPRSYVPPLSAAELIHRYSEGERRFTAVNLPGAAFPAGTCLRQIELPAAALAGSTLAGCDLTGADLSDADLSAANAVGATFTNATLSGAQLSRARATRAVFRGARMHRADLTDANMELADLSDVMAGMTEVSFTNFHGAVMRRADLSGAKGAEPQFVNADLRRADLRTCVLARPAFLSANLTRAKLDQAVFKGGDLRDIRARRASFRDATFDGVVLHGADFEEGDLRGLRGAVLDECRTRGTRFDPVRARDTLTPRVPRWLVLRAAYTGGRLAFHLMLLTGFLIPLVSKSMLWSMVNEVQPGIATQVGEFGGHIELLRTRILADSAVPGFNLLPPAARDTVKIILKRVVDSLASDALRRATPCLASQCDTVRVWQLVTNQREGGWEFGLTITLIVYNLARAYLTYRVAPLRDAELYVGVSPAFDEYRSYWRVHLIFTGLLLVAVTYFIWKSAHAVLSIVVVPT